MPPFNGEISFSSESKGCRCFQKVHLKMFFWLYLRWFTQRSLQSSFWGQVLVIITTCLLFLQIYIFKEYWNMATLFVVSSNSNFSYQIFYFLIMSTPWNLAIVRILIAILFQLQWHSIFENRFWKREISWYSLYSQVKFSDSYTISKLNINTC